MVIRKPKSRKVWNEILAQGGDRADAANYSPVKPTLVRPQVRRENVQKVQNLATPLGVAGLAHHKPNKMF